MTLPPSDSPDWTGIPGGLRYLGTIDMTGTGTLAGSLALAPASYDYSIYVIQTGSPLSDSLYARIGLLNNDLSVRTAQAYVYRQGEFMEDAFVGFVAQALGNDWEVFAEVNDADASTWQLWVFAAPTFPLVDIVRNQRPLLVRQVGVPRRQEVADQAWHIPASGVRATVTFAADPVGTLGWVLDHASWRLFSRGTADITSIRVLDGATVIYSHRTSVPVTTGLLDEHQIGPLMGLRSSPGNALVVDFGAAPAAGNFETVSASAYTWAVF